MKWRGIRRDSIDIGKADQGLLAINTRFKVDGEMRRRRGLARTSIQRKAAGVTSISGFSAFQSNVMAALTDGDRIQGYQQPYALWGDNPDYTPVFLPPSPWFDPDTRIRRKISITAAASGSNHGIEITSPFASGRVYVGSGASVQCYLSGYATDYVTIPFANGYGIAIDIWGAYEAGAWSGSTSFTVGCASLVSPITLTIAASLFTNPSSSATIVETRDGLVSPTSTPSSCTLTIGKTFTVALDEDGTITIT